ncbi:peptidylprolyl isomerase [Tepidimonas charontis]|uniref:Chaperone SurA n=1 Tax=Tepidimonas charontis TaxID=2267262 RepID=A0A554XAA8_9BURK|nr:peptidylprolyl isomerase [Tepidimonas charontis]TSE32753.1 Chaperone SurA [Tepidimonas charontis]
MNKSTPIAAAVAAALAAAMLLTSAPVAAQPRTAAAATADYVVVLINGEPITLSDVRRRLAELNLPADLPAAERAALPQRVLERLIDERVLLQWARESGLRVEDSAVDAAEAEVARRNGLTVAQLRERLPSAGLTVTTFRDNLRNELLLQRLREREAARVRVTEADIDAALREQQEGNDPARTVLELAHVLIPVPENARAEDEARARALAEDVTRRARAGEDFAALARQYSRAPEAAQGGRLGLRTADRYPTLFWEAVRAARSGDIVGPLRSGAGFHVLQVLTRRAADWPDPVVTQTRVRHILLRASDEAAQRAASERLRALRERIVSGQITFEAAAREVSEDGSARDGGLLGWASPGLFVPEFEQAMDALPVGSVSAPVVTRFGVHLIEVLERRRVERSAREQREAVRAVLRQRKADEAIQELVREQRARAFIEQREPPQ